MGLIVALATLHGALTLGASPAHAQDSAFEDPSHWAFSTALEVGIYGHTGKGNTVGSPLTGPRVSPPLQLEDLGPNVVEPERSREEVLSALVGGTFELMSPQLIDSAGRPRIFLDVNVTSALAAEVGLARDGDPGEMSLPPDATPNSTIGEAAILGRGTAITVQPQGPQVHAGLGTAFTIEQPDYQLRIKPSVVYSRTILDVDAVANRAVRLPPPGGPPTLETHYRLIELQDDFTEIYHGLGPALEIEYEPGTRIGPFGITLYLKGHASQIFGDLETDMVGCNDDPAAPGECVRWSYKQDRWAFRAATGIRLRWDPWRGR